MSLPALGLSVGSVVRKMNPLFRLMQERIDGANSVLLGLVDTGQWRRRFEQSGSGMDFTAWSAEITRDRGVKLGRFGTADEVAFHILTLLSPLSGYTTGATIDVGGGVGRYV